MTDNDDQAMRDFTKRLFSHRETTDEALPPPKPAGHVAREGNNSDTTPTDPFREFVADLFGTDENARGLHNPRLD